MSVVVNLQWCSRCGAVTRNCTTPGTPASTSTPKTCTWPWEAPDGTQWLHFPDLDGGLWTGWQPGEPGIWNLSEEEFRAGYPERRDQ